MGNPRETRNSSTSSPNVYNCGTCKSSIQLGDRAPCGSCRKSFHYGCVSLNKSDVACFTGKSKGAFRWFCPDCIPAVPPDLGSIIRGFEDQKDKLSQQQVEIDQLKQQVNSLLLNSPGGRGSRAGQSANDPMLIELISRTVSETVTRVLSDVLPRQIFSLYSSAREQEETRNNVVMFNFEEKEGNDDLSEVRQMAQDQGIEPEEVVSCRRTRPSREGKAKMLKVKFRSQEAKSSFLALARKKVFPGQSGEDALYIRNDLTYQQRMAMKEAAASGARSGGPPKVTPGPGGTGNDFAIGSAGGRRDGKGSD